ncbi:MAG: thioesterase family protein, partial [Pseudomonadales bacterium]|nr:thioesterase family protein [Pseudomonadales bacterium]
LFTKKPSDAYQAVSLPLLVMPWDCDANFHINNGRYLSIMDVARVQLYLDAGIVRPMMKNSWVPVVTSSHLLYRRSIDIFVKYDLSSQFVGRTEKFLIVEHRFKIKGKTAVLSYVALAFRDKNGVVDSDRLVEGFNLQNLSAESHPEIIDAFLKADKQFLDAL